MGVAQGNTRPDVPNGTTYLIVGTRAHTRILGICFGERQPVRILPGTFLPFLCEPSFFSTIFVVV